MDAALTLFLNQYIDTAGPLILFAARWLIFISAAVAGIVLVARYLLQEFNPGMFARAGIFISASVVLAWLQGEAINAVFLRSRPFIASTDITPLFVHGALDSFPSGHAIAAFALAAALWYYAPKTSIFLFAAAVCIGVGRIAAGLHWPSDVLAGAILGVSTVLLLRAIIRRFFVI